ncbi:MAG: 7-cyano-7-deazaguanine synthase, partial [Gammaproteobacteria bacterium]|nr:7-cyano-7-deazaguanine synthase [Gammaproteobacteria bacterium]
MEKALVVLSGGQDSTTCLYWAIDRFGAEAVASVTFDYGQRHRVEIDCAAAIADFAGISNTCLPIDTFAALGGDALTDPDIDVGAGVVETTGLPNTFVAGRNLIFLTYAAAFAY